MSSLFDLHVKFQIRAECLATRYDAALFNMSYFGKFWLKGPQAQVCLRCKQFSRKFCIKSAFSQAAANWIFSNQVEAPIGKTIYTCMLNERAGIEADLTVSVLGTEEVISFRSTM